MGSKHLRLAVALVTAVYSDPQLGADAKKTLDAVFMNMDLETDALGTKVRIMKWRTLYGNNDGALECAFAPEAREAETVLVKLLTQNGGKESHGTAPRGPAIRKMDETIADTWRKTMRADKQDA